MAEVGEEKKAMSRNVGGQGECLRERGWGTLRPFLHEGSIFLRGWYQLSYEV
jgi:hypothetical protein